MNLCDAKRDHLAFAEGDTPWHRLIVSATRSAALLCNDELDAVTGGGAMETIVSGLGRLSRREFEWHGHRRGTSAAGGSHVTACFGRQWPENPDQ